MNGKKGTIRFFLGFFIVFGAVGTLDVDASASLVTQMMIAAAGLGVMYSGAKAMKKV
jgi:hypothetical protein